MAERRMFAKTIIDSDAFLDMPISARLLYYDLAMRADDDGFVNSPKKIMRMIGATQDDLSILALRKFIIPFEVGIVVIKHWKIHNYIRKDTYNETKYLKEKELLELDENNSYRLKKSEYNISVYEPSTQVRLGKDSLDNNNIYGQNSEEHSENKIEILEDWQLKFKKFYKKYPKKVKKQTVEKWFEKNKPSNELFSSMLHSLEQFRASKDWQKDGGQYIPYPSTWLNQKRWEDEGTEEIQENKLNNSNKREYKENDLNNLYANKGGTIL